MSLRSIIAAVAGLLILLSVALSASAASLTVKGEAFVLTLPDGRQFGSAQLIGAELRTSDGQTIRIDALMPAKERASVLLHRFSVRDPATGSWTPACDADAYGRQAGFLVAGRIDTRGRYVRDASAWFMTCTSGSQGKCVLWGYDPWSPGPHGEDLTALYQACQHAVRANYDGKGEAHTKNGTSIDVFDRLGIETPDSLGNPAYAFEAGWSPDGAVCVARTRWPDLISREALLATAPALGGLCDEVEASRRGAILFTRVMVAPVITTSAGPQQ